MPFLLLLLSLLVYSDTLLWLVRRWQGADGTVHVVVAVFVCILLVRTTRLSVALRRAPLILLLVGNLAVFALFQTSPTNTVRGVGLVLTTYALLGLFVDSGVWRAQRGLAVLGMGVLPLTGHLDTLLGFPLRQATASITARLFGGSLSTATVMQFEGGLAQVDIPCSGIQSLWSAAIVMGLAAVVWRQRVGIRFLFALQLAVLLLLLSNLGRVVTLVFAHHILELPVVAEILHLPLGVMGFVLSLAPALVLMRGPTPTPVQTPTVSVRWALPAFVALCLVALPGPEAPRAPAPLELPWTQIALTEAELAHAESQGARIEKVALEPGSAVFVKSTNWRAHHVPEQCHTAGGWTLSDAALVTSAGRPMRWARATRGTSEGTVFWWFQAPDRWTADHTERMADGLFDDTPWVLVSVLVPGSPEPDDLFPLVNALAKAAASNLES